MKRHKKKKQGHVHLKRGGTRETRYNRNVLNRGAVAEMHGREKSRKGGSECLIKGKL